MKGKVSLARGGWRGRLRKIKEPRCFPNAVAAGEGLSSRRAGAREKPTAVSLQPPKACAHTLPHTHTRPGARSGGHVSLARPRTAHTPHPGRGSSPPGDAPHSPPPESHWTWEWRGTRRARGEDDPPRSAPQTPRQGGRARGGWRRGATEARGAPGARPGAARGGRKPRRGGERAPGAQLLTGSAGRRAGRRGGDRGALGGVAAGDTLGCLEGAAGGGGRASAAPPQTSASGGDLLPPLPPWAYTQTPFFSHFIFPLQSPPAPGSPACTPNPRPQRIRRRPVPAMSLLFWDRSALAALSPLGEARSPGAARSLTQLPAARLGPLLPKPWRRLEKDARAPEESGVTKT